MPFTHSMIPMTFKSSNFSQRSQILNTASLIFALFAVLFVALFVSTASAGAPSPSALAAAPVRSTQWKNGPLVHTFSIVARDAKTGEMGVAVQSHWFSVGSGKNSARKPAVNT